MRAILVLALLLPGACGRADPVGDNAGIGTNQIERLATAAPPPPVDEQRLARPQPLTPADLAGEGMPNPACDFSSGGRMLLAASSSDAIARIDGRLFHFNHSSPVGPTGGFLEDRQLSISVGRLGPIAGKAGAGGSWPARITFTNRRAPARVETTGIWRCGG